MNKSETIHRCDNKHCDRRIEPNNTIFRCFNCDFDLCDRCFQLDFVTEPVPLADDDQFIDDNAVCPINELLVVSIN
jgi:hypothetical protein